MPKPRNLFAVVPTVREMVAAHGGRTTGRSVRRIRTVALCVAAMIAAGPSHAAGTGHDRSPGWAHRAYAGSASPFIAHLERTDGLQLDAGEGYRAWLHLLPDPESARIRIAGRDWPRFTRSMTAGGLVLQCAAARPHRDPPEPAIPVFAALWISRHPDDEPLPTLTGEPVKAALAWLLRGAGSVIPAGFRIGGRTGEPVTVEIPHLDWSVPDADIGIPLDGNSEAVLAAVALGHPFVMDIAADGEDTHMALEVHPTREQAAAAAAMRRHCAETAPGTAQ